MFGPYTNLCIIFFLFFSGKEYKINLEYLCFHLSMVQRIAWISGIFAFSTLIGLFFGLDVIFGKFCVMFRA